MSKTTTTSNLEILVCARWSLEQILTVEDKILKHEPVSFRHIHQVTQNLKSIIELAGGEKFDTPIADRKAAASRV